MSSNRSLRVVGVTLLFAIAGTGIWSTLANGDREADRSQIVRVMKRGKAALLAGKARTVCSLLTDHGRRRVLEFRVDFDDYGRIPADSPRLPQTCEAMVLRQLRSDRSWFRDLRRARSSVVWIRGSAAKVRLKVAKPYGDEVSFWLRKQRGAWLINESDGVPAGH